MRPVSGLGVATDRIDTIADFEAAARHGVKTDGGSAAGPGARVLAELAGLTADGQLELPIANVCPANRSARPIASLNAATRTAR